MVQPRRPQVTRGLPMQQRPSAMMQAPAQPAVPARMASFSQRSSAPQYQAQPAQGSISPLRSPITAPTVAQPQSMSAMPAQIRQQAQAPQISSYVQQQAQPRQQMQRIQQNQMSAYGQPQPTYTSLDPSIPTPQYGMGFNPNLAPRPSTNPDGSPIRTGGVTPMPYDQTQFENEYGRRGSQVPDTDWSGRPIDSEKNRALEAARQAKYQESQRRLSSGVGMGKPYQPGGDGAGGYFSDPPRTGGYSPVPQAPAQPRPRETNVPPRRRSDNPFGGYDPEMDEIEAQNRNFGMPGSSEYSVAPEYRAEYRRLYGGGGDGTGGYFSDPPRTGGVKPNRDSYGRTPDDPQYGTGGVKPNRDSYGRTPDDPQYGTGGIKGPKPVESPMQPDGDLNQHAVMPNQYVPYIGEGDDRRFTGMNPDLAPPPASPVGLGGSDMERYIQQQMEESRNSATARAAQSLASQPAPTRQNADGSFMGPIGGSSFTTKTGFNPDNKVAGVATPAFYKQGGKVAPKAMAKPASRASAKPAVKGYAKGGTVMASSRGDGIAQRGKTKGRIR